jgi:predicted RNase H-like nuclease (RuvC/YqgF family)
MGNWENTATIITSLVIAIPGILSFYRQYKEDQAKRRTEERKQNTEITDISQKALIGTITFQKGRIQELETENKDLQKTIDDLEAENRRLRRRNQGLGTHDT